MEKKDFKKGQTVYLLLMEDMAKERKRPEERIEEWEVVSVGKKYITTQQKDHTRRKVQFEIENNFRQVCQEGTADYILYLSKEDAVEKLKRDNLVDNIKSVCRWDGYLRKLSTDQLERIYKIMTEDRKDNKC